MNSLTQTDALHVVVELEVLDASLRSIPAENDPYTAV